MTSPVKCQHCGRKFKEQNHLNQHVAAKHSKPTADEYDPRTEPDWGGECEVCGSSPIVPATGMCGPCTFGEADTIGGNW